MTKLAKSSVLLKMKTVAIPKSWKKAAGLAKSKKKSLQKHAGNIRKEWDK